MKKRILYISILASITLFNACELNDSPEFDDANAFVAFSSENISVKEDAETFVVPVRLTSLKGIATTVSFEIIDSTAVQGVDFELDGGASVLTFDSKNPTQDIRFNILPHIGVFTGDLLFGVRITSSGSVNTGTIDTVYVTLLDIDHPLSFILGDFNATATSHFNGSETWTVTLAKDVSDTKKVWITNLVKGGSSASSPVYGMVNDEKTEIKIPVGQVIAISSAYDVILEGFYGPDGESNIPDGQSITGLIDPDGTIHIQDEFGSHVYDKGTTNSLGWYNVFQADGVFVKK
ncbi:MAG: hypothetical protein LBS25_09850 [Candidatus Symbiothrix sp.]|jgi:hypothetical protein|nr:hypothetical protein [Candidatus Symbiothrix sp.]